MQTVSPSVLQPMMQFNTRSVLRPEYLNYSNTEYSYASFYQDKYSDRRINTNTAPVYSTENPGPPRRKIAQRRASGHPYFRSFKSPQTSEVSSDLVEFPPVPEHPAFHIGTSTIPVQIDINAPENHWSQDSNRKPKTLSRSSSAFIPPSSSSRQRSPAGSSSGSSPNCPTTASSHSRSYSHGQAEQLRRSRESTTFALIDNQLSKPPLNQVRDMYLQNRVGANSSSSTPARTTKKANLSAVHTVVRFRIKDYLISMMGHTRRMLDNLFSSIYPDYNPSARDALASQLFGQSQLPCSLSCEFCERFRCQLDHQMPSRKMVFSKSLLPQSKCALSSIEKPYSTSCLNSSEFFASKVSSPDSVRRYDLSDMKQEASSNTTPLSSPSSPQLNFDLLDDNSETDMLENLQDVVDEVTSGLPSQPFNDIPLPDFRSPSSTMRLDSVSARLRESFDLESMYFSSSNPDFELEVEDHADLQNLLLGNHSEIKLEPFDDASSLSVIDELDALNKILPKDCLPLDSGTGIKQEPLSYSLTPTQTVSPDSSSSCESRCPY